MYKANDGEKVNLYYLNLIIYKVNKFLKSAFTRSALQDIFSSVKFLKYKSFWRKQQQLWRKTVSSSLYQISFYVKIRKILTYFHYELSTAK